MTKTSITYFTNLYPLPWEPTRAAYNYQIVEALRQEADVEVLIPVPATVWIRQLFKGNTRKSSATLFPFFFLPGIGRRTYAFTMLLSMLLCIYPLIKLAKSKHIIASWAYPEGVVATWFKRFFGSKVAIHCVGTDINYHFQYPARQKQMLKAFQRADRVITVSQDLADKIHARAADVDIDVVYNGVSFEAFAASPLALQEGKLLFIGNWLKTKGIYELIEAMAVLKAKGYPAHLDIVGKGPEASQMAERIEQLNIGDAVTLRGPVLHKDIPVLLSQANALVLPSYREGVPNVIMESLAAGVPPIATAVGGIPEIIRDGENGILISDISPEAVAESIERALNSTWRAETLRQSVAPFTWKNCATGFLKALRLQ